MLVDTHCHLTHERYGGDLPELLRRAAEAGVTGVISIASDLEDVGKIRAIRESLASPAQAEGQPESDVRRDVGSAMAAPWIRGTAGIHPHEAQNAPPDLRERLLDLVAEDQGLVAVGECGLDFHYDFSPRPIQHRVFDVHLEVAAETDLPLVVHCREAEQEMARLVREAGDAGVRGVLHCFSGDVGLFDAAMESGWLISFTGMVTFGSFAGSDVVRAVPSDRYMLETDGPYMSPVPHRGTRNEPARVTHIRDRIAELRGTRPDVVEGETGATATSFFRLSAGT